MYTYIIPTLKYIPVEVGIKLCGCDRGSFMCVFSQLCLGKYVHLVAIVSWCMICACMQLHLFLVGYSFPYSNSIFKTHSCQRGYNNVWIK